MAFTNLAYVRGSATGSEWSIDTIHDYDRTYSTQDLEAKEIRFFKSYDSASLTGDSAPYKTYWYDDDESDFRKRGVDNRAFQASKDDLVEPTHIDKDEDKHDPWHVTLSARTKCWTELDARGKVLRVLWHGFFKVILLFLLIYLFSCSLDLLGISFALFGDVFRIFLLPVADDRRYTELGADVFRNGHVLQNPIACLMLGVLATVLVQSSSISIMVLISLVAVQVIPVSPAIFIMMGANVGTCITNNIAALVQAADTNTFRRAVGGATVHDMFNWLTVLILLPIEWAFNMLYHLTKAVLTQFAPQRNTDASPQLLKVITKPLTNLIIQVDQAKMYGMSGGAGYTGASIIKQWCNDTRTYWRNIANQNGTLDQGQNGTSIVLPLNATQIITKTEILTASRCKFLFVGVAEKWGDAAIGALLLLLSLLLLAVCLVCFVKLMQSFFLGGVAARVQRLVNSGLPDYWSLFSDLLVIIIGAGMTIVVQSSSILTLALTPLVGTGMLRIERMYVLTLGANIGTTFAPIMASLAVYHGNVPIALQVALCHLFFNVFGLCIWFPVPLFRRVPVRLARFLGNKTAKYRWFAITYLLFMFLIIPLLVFGLSLAGWYILLAVAVPVIIVIIFVIVVNILQTRKPQWLPNKLKTWHFLPMWMRSLQPYDKIFSRLYYCCRCYKMCGDTPAGRKKVKTDPMKVLERTHPRLYIDYPVDSTQTGFTQNGKAPSVLENGIILQKDNLPDNGKSPFSIPVAQDPELRYQRQAPVAQMEPYMGYNDLEDYWNRPDTPSSGHSSIYETPQMERRGIDTPPSVQYSAESTPRLQQRGLPSNGFPEKPFDYLSPEAYWNEAGPSSGESSPDIFTISHADGKLETSL